MNTGHDSRALSSRRHHLQARVAQQRLALGHDLLTLSTELSPAAWVARGAMAAQRRPAWLLAGAAALVAARRLGLRRLISHAWTAWRFWRAARNLFASPTSNERYSR